MEYQEKEIQSVIFAEHIWKPSDSMQINEFDIIITGPYSYEKYSESLFRKTISIGLSEIAPFLDYQCGLVKAPVSWLNSFEKLIKLNLDFFEDRQSQHRHYKLISQIDLKRHVLQSSELVSHRSFHLRRTVNGFSEDREYSFASVKEQLREIATHEEKIAFLHEQIFDYRQDSPDFVSVKEKPFDVLCELEIEKLEKKESLLQKVNMKTINNLGIEPLHEKIKINGRLNYFVDFYFQLMHEKIVDGKPFLESSNSNIAKMICNNFVDRNGKPISFKTVMTILEVNRIDKRPKDNKRFGLD